jgi:hypothetical protein
MPGARRLMSSPNAKEREQTFQRSKHRASSTRAIPAHRQRPIRKLTPQTKATLERSRKSDDEKEDGESETGCPRAWLKQQQTAPERRGDDAEDYMPSVRLRPPPHGQSYSKKEHDQCDDLVGIGDHFVSIFSHSRWVLYHQKALSSTSSKHSHEY